MTGTGRGPSGRSGSSRLRRACPIRWSGWRSCFRRGSCIASPRWHSRYRSSVPVPAGWLPAQGAWLHRCLSIDFFLFSYCMFLFRFRKWCSLRVGQVGRLGESLVDGVYGQHAVQPCAAAQGAAHATVPHDGQRLVFALRRC